MVVKPVLAFSYKCPYCGQVTGGRMELFSLSRRSLSCVCACGQSALRAEVCEGNIKIEVPCAYCSEQHSTTVDLSALLHRKLNAILCTSTGFPTCYAGLPEMVDGKAAGFEPSIGELVQSLMAMSPMQLLNGREGELLGRIDRGTEAAGPEIVAGALGAVKELAYGGLVTCPCGSKKFRLSFDTCFVEISCAQCGACARFPAHDAVDVEAIRQSGPLVLADRQTAGSTKPPNGHA